MEHLRRVTAAVRGARRDHTESGVTLVEVVVAMILLGILSAAVLGVLLSAQRSSVDSRNRVAAANLAAREIDLVREQFMASDAGPLEVANEGVVVNGNPIDAIAAVGDPLVVDGTAYTVRRSVGWNLTGSGASACEGGSLVEHPTLIVTVEVTWSAMGTTHPVVNTAVLAPERGLGLATTASFVAVSVTDSDGQPSAGRAVTVSSTGTGGETRTGLTDSSGCAVIAVNPPAGGNEYTARFPDAGYVDISGTTAPERPIGVVQPGQMASNVDIALDRAGTLILRLTGPGLTQIDVAGSTVSLYQSEYSGSSAISQHPVTGLETTITGLWPTQYAGFFGSTLPANLGEMADLAPGGSAVLEVPFVFAEFTLASQPAPGTAIAVRAAAGATCTTSGARTVDPAAGRLPGGSWVFFVDGPSFGCSPGPGSGTPVQLDPGDNGEIVWGASPLRVTGAPTGEGAIWAVSAAVATATCQVPSPPTDAVKLADDGGTVGPANLPAGNWYVFAMPEAGGVPSGGTCSSAGSGPVAVPYGGTTFAWPTSSATVRVIDVPTSPGSQWRVVASSVLIASCASSSPPGGVMTFSPDSATTVSGVLQRGAWYVYRWRTSGGSGSSCTLAPNSPISVGWASSYTLDWTSGSVTTP